MLDPVAPPLQPARASTTQTIPMPCGSISGGRDLPAARIRRLPAGILPGISCHASSLSVPRDARLALARLNATMVLATRAGRPTWIPRSRWACRHQSPTHLALDRPPDEGRGTFECSAATTLDRVNAGDCSVLYRPRNLRGRIRDRQQKIPRCRIKMARPPSEDSMRTRIIHLINPKTDSLTTRPDLPQPGPLLAAGRPARRRRRDSARSLRGGADRREHRDHRLRPQGRPRRHLRHDELRQPRLRDRRSFPRAGRPRRHGRRAPELHAAGGAQALRRRRHRRSRARHRAGSSTISSRARCAGPTARTGCIRWTACRCRATTS